MIFYVMVNIPTYNLQVVKNGKTIHETRVVVGQKKHKTPIFSDEMEYVVVNPYWNVPKLHRIQRIASQDQGRSCGLLLQHKL